jgi:hypothetical protein
VRKGGSIDSIPLKAHVQVRIPKNKPRIMCSRFWPGYGILVGVFLNRYLREGEYNETPTINPRSAMMVPIPEDQIMMLLQYFCCVRSGVKYSQCGMAPSPGLARRRGAIPWWCTGPPLRTRRKHRPAVRPETNTSIGAGARGARTELSTDPLG